MPTPKKGRPYADPKAGRMTNFTAPLPAELVKALRKQAKADKTTASGLVRKALGIYLKYP